MKEVVNKRSENSKVFDLGKGKTMFRFHSSPIHFNKNDKWEDINPKLENINGKYKSKNTYYDLDIPENKSKLGFIVGELKVEFIPINEKIDFESINTGIRKLVTFTSKPKSNQIKFEFNIPKYADVYYKNGKTNLLLRKKLKALNKKRRFCEKNNDYSTARALFKEQKALEIKLYKKGLTKWNKKTTITFSGGMEIRSKSDVIYIKQPLVWDSSEKLEPIDIILSKEGKKLYFTKQISNDFLQTATYPVQTDATASYFVGVGDGWIRRETTADTTWSLARDTADGNFAFFTPSSATVFCRSSKFTAPSTYFTIRRYFFPTDTSAIEDADEITSASFNWYYSNGSVLNTDTTSIELVETNQASSSELVAGDYDAYTNISIGSQLFSSISGLGYKSIDITDLDVISKTGTTFIGAISGLDLNNTAPTAQNHINGTYFSEQSGTANDPFIEITTSSGGGGGNGNLLLMGIG